MVKDMTTGNSLKLILAFSVPMLLGNLFQQFYNMVDSIVVGKYVSTNALAAVGATGSLNFLVIGFVMGICTGFNIKVSQAFGSGNHSEMRSYIINGTYLCAFFTIILTGLTLLFTRPVLVLMRTPSVILDDAYNYIIIVFAGIFVIMAYNYLSCIQRALGDSRTPLYFLIVASLINIVLDLVFVLHFHMGVKGVGYATVIAQGIAALLCLLYMKKHYSILNFTKEELHFDWNKCKQLMGIGVPMALQFSITAIGSIILQIAVNSLGPNSVAAVTAANRLQIMFTQPLETLGLTMATFCGQNLGANKLNRIQDGIRIALKLSISYCLILLVVMMVFAPKFSLLFVNAGETEVITKTVEFLRINSCFYMALGILFILRNSLQGLGFSILPMFAGVVELVGRSVVAICFVTFFHYRAVCIASPVAWILADILLVVVYYYKVIKGYSIKNKRKAHAISNAAI